MSMNVTMTPPTFGHGDRLAGIYEDIGGTSAQGGSSPEEIIPFWVKRLHSEATETIYRLDQFIDDARSCPDQYEAANELRYNIQKLGIRVDKFVSYSSDPTGKGDSDPEPAALAMSLAVFLKQLILEAQKLLDRCGS
jgi:hypothetical protein